MDVPTAEEIGVVAMPIMGKAVPEIPVEVVANLKVLTKEVRVRNIAHKD